METFDTSSVTKCNISEESENIKSIKEETTKDKGTFCFKTSLKPKTSGVNGSIITLERLKRSSNVVTDESQRQSPTTSRRSAASKSEVITKSSDATSNISPSMTVVDHTDGTRREVEENGHRHGSGEKNDIDGSSSSVCVGNKNFGCKSEENMKLEDHRSHIERNGSGHVTDKDTAVNLFPFKTDIPQKRKTRSSSSPSGKFGHNFLF